MIIGFIVWSVCAAIFLGIGVSCRKSKEAVGFFTFVKPPAVEDVKGYNNAVSILWMAAAGVLEVIGLPFVLLEQNSPLIIFIVFAVVILLIAMMIVYMRIEARYRK